MLRIIAGHLRSRLFKALPSKKSHPMSDRGRMALFNMLGDLSQVEMVLDAYGGSGALAFEALSRGAQAATIIEIDGRVYKQLVENVQHLGLHKRAKVYRANNVTCLNNLNQEFDLVFLDPPFDNFKEDQILKLGQYLKVGGHLVLSHPPHCRSPLPDPPFECIKDRQYAQLCLKIYVRRQEKSFQGQKR